MVTVTTSKDSYTRNEAVHAEFHVKTLGKGSVHVGLYGDVGSKPIIQGWIIVNPKDYTALWTIPEQAFYEHSTYDIQGIYPDEPTGNKKINHVPHV